VLWITGPPGVGKSTASWQLFTELARTGVPVAFADTDQLCMCYPAPAGDPGRERIKARNVATIVARARESGARCVIANGVLDPARGVLAELMPHAEVTVCRLRADEDELVRRLLGRPRGASHERDLLRGTLDDARAMDASDFAHACADTTGTAVSEVAGLIRSACHDWAGFSELGGTSAPAQRAESSVDEREPAVAEPAGHVLLICGATGVGKSTIGFQAYLRWLREGRTAGYIDVGQIGFLRPAPADDPGCHRLKAANLAAMWQNYRAAGATHLIATGRIESELALQKYVRALPAAGVTVCRLHVGPSELLRRILSRADGGSWPEPGDPLRGRPAGYLRRVAAEAAAQAQDLERQAIGAVRIDTEGLTVPESADQIADLPAVSQADSRSPAPSSEGRSSIRPA
jgi:adenylylsulfate kinase-like enzyme